MTQKKSQQKIVPLSNFEESLLYMSYRYAIGRHTIHSHCHAGDIMSNFYERLKLTPERMIFTSKDINQSIEDIIRFNDVYIDNKNYNKNIFPYELYITVLNKELEKNPEFDISTYKHINIFVDCDNKYIDHEIIMNDNSDNESYRKYSMLNDLEIWHNVAKVFDLNEHHTVKLIDDSIVEYVEIINSNSFVKVLLPDYIYNTSVYKTIPDNIIKETIVIP